MVAHDPTLGWRPELQWKPRSLPTASRRRQLHQAQQRNIEAGQPPNTRIKLSRADVEWLITRNGGPVQWGDDRRGHAGLDLRGADLSNSDLSYLPLADTLLQDSVLTEASLAGADLRWAFLNGSHASSAEFRDADLFKVHFDGAYLRDADFCSANLRSAWLDDATYLDGANLNGAFLSGCHWRDADIVHVKWEDLRIIGEEKQAQANSSHEKASPYAEAADAYGRLSQLLRIQGKLPDASRFYYRSNLMRRKADSFTILSGVKTQHWDSVRSALPRLAWRLAIEKVAGYGEYPGRVLIWALTTILAFTGLYMLFGSTQGHPFGFSAAFVFSLSSMLGRGYALVLPFSKLAEPASLLSTIEGAIGLTLEILFVTTFTRRLIGGT